MSGTPRTDDIWYDTSRKYNGQLASSLYDLCRELERENAELRTQISHMRHKIEKLCKALNRLIEEEASSVKEGQP